MSRSGFSAPAPLMVASSLVVVEGLLLLGYAVLEAANTHSERVAMAVSTALFLALYGGGLLACGWAISRGHAWARSPIMLSQLIWLGVAWSFRAGSTTGVAIGMAVVALVVLAGVLHPRSLDALADDGSQEAS